MNTQTLMDRAMLCVLSIGGFPASRRKNAETTIKTLAAELMGTGGGEWYDNIYPDNAFAELSKIATDARTINDEIAKPWGKGGNRILPSCRYMEHTAAMRMMRARFFEAVRSFADQRDEHIKWGKDKLGKHFDESNYPVREELLARFYFQVHYAPISDPNDFRIGMATADLEAVRASMKADMEAAMKEHMRETWGQAAGALTRLLENLRERKPVVRDGKQVRTKDMTAHYAGVLRELVDTLPELNVVGDKRFDAAVADIKQKLLCTDKFECKENEVARKKAAAETEDILARMSGYMQ